MITYKSQEILANHDTFVFSTWFPPAATLKKELGEQLVSIGMVGAALELFEEVELWDPLIVCLSLLGKKQQAADLVRRRLDADDRNPKLWWPFFP